MLAMFKWLKTDFDTPYRVMFVIGSLHLLLGALVWILFSLNLITYPGISHSHLMMQGFLLSFATGFLMTAVPKFLGAPVAKVWEVSLAALISLSPVAVFVSTDRRCLWMLCLMQILWIVYYGASRFARRSYAPPSVFIFLPLGFFSGLTGCFLLLMGEDAGRILVFEGMLLAFVLGIGSKLLSSLLGWQAPISIQLENRKSSLALVLERRFIIEACFFAIGILLHSMGQTQLADLAWALTATSIAFGRWKLHRRPLTRGALTWCLWASAWSIVVGLWLNFAFSNLRVHMVHAVYVSGMCLMTLGVATRVILAHGGYSLEIERRSKALRSMMVLMILAMLTRVSAPLLSGESYFRHLIYASSLILLGTMIWIFSILRRVIKSA